MRVFRFKITFANDFRFIRLPIYTLVDCQGWEKNSNPAGFFVLFCFEHKQFHNQSVSRFSLLSWVRGCGSFYFPNHNFVLPIIFVSFLRRILICLQKKIRQTSTKAQKEASVCACFCFVFKVMYTVLLLQFHNNSDRTNVSQVCVCVFFSYETSWQHFCFTEKCLNLVLISTQSPLKIVTWHGFVWFSW